MKTPRCGDPLQSSSALIFSNVRGKVIPQWMQETLFLGEVRRFWEQRPFVLVTSNTRIDEIRIALISTR